MQDPAVQRQLAQLAARDREVRAHEQAHVAAGGSIVTSGPTYVYQIGPDNRRYAVGGEVGIDTSPVRGDPEATLDKARQIRAAALAPAQPSAQDLQVAAQASRMEQSARLELARQERDAAYQAVSSDARSTPGEQLSEVA
nr:putative metalloprotease CJM1_0395 family protein [Lysobacter sp. CAU 1642]